MKHNRFSLLIAIAMIALIGLAALPASAQSKTTTGATSSDLIWGPGSGPSKVTGLEATSDKAGSLAIVYGRTSVATPYKVNGAAATGQAVIPLALTTGLASNDTVVCYGPGVTPYKATLITVTTSNCTASANLTAALTNGCFVQEMTKLYSIPVGSASVNRASGPFVVTPAASAVWISLDSTSTNALSATVE